MQQILDSALAAADLCRVGVMPFAFGGGLSFSLVGVVRSSRVLECFRGFRVLEGFRCFRNLGVLGLAVEDDYCSLGFFV